MPRHGRRLLFAFVLATAATAADRPDAVFGDVLPVTEGCAIVEPDPAFSSLPITVELWARLDASKGYNILIANETKASATHWELFTTPGDGIFHAYLPGHKPDHAHSTVAIADGKWHHLAMVLEDSRARLFVDGQMVVDQALSPLAAARIPGPLAFGALVSGELMCSGAVDEVRISRGVRDIRVPETELTPDAETIALWHFDETERKVYRDASPAAIEAKWKPNTAWVQAGGEAIPGGMPIALQPLPPAEDPAPLRAALAHTSEQLGLKSVAPDSIRDAVLRQWSWDLRGWNRIDYPDARGTWMDRVKAAEQVYDRQALVWETDGGPLGTVLRRTEALLADLRASAGGPGIDGATRDLAVLRDAAGRRPAGGGSADLGLYLAVCAVRRQLALSDPLLDFDTLFCVARGTFAGSVRSNPATGDYQGGHFVTQYFGFNALPGGGLYLIRNFRTKPKAVNLLADSVVQNGRFKGRKLDFGAFATPDLDFDGRRIVFSWTPNREHKWTYSRDTCWHLFRVNADGSDLTQLTDGADDDFDPCWLPSGRIAFSSERRGGHIRCFAAYLKVRNYTLFSVRDDGSDLTPLSYYETSEWNPNVTADGRLVYTRWDYTDRENCLGSRAWFSGPDGTDPRAPHGNYPLPYDTFLDHALWGKWPDGREMDSRIGAPLVEMGIRQVPGSQRFLFTAAPHHGEVFGTLGMLDLRVEDDHHMSQVRRVTPGEPFPETEMPGRRHYKFGTPWPLSDDLYLCNVWEDLALLDRYGNQELLFGLRELPGTPDERLRLIDPIPLRPRPRPPVVPSRIEPGKPATIAVMNVYDSDLPFPAGTKIHWLRVTQNCLKTNHPMGEPMIGYERENTPRIPLGIVPVEADGSVYFTAPPAKELIFQVLDENRMAVQSMRSVAFVHPGEQLTCRGCHERPHGASAPEGTPLALQRPPSTLQPELPQVEPISYYRQIKPILDARCVPCHREKHQGPEDMSYEALREGYTFWFAGAMYQDMTSAYSGVHGGSRTIPGRFGARASRIGQALLDATHRPIVGAEDRQAIVLWLDSNSLRLGSFQREEAQLRGELVWPELDVDPRNPLGLGSTGAPLAASFWHEQTYGPHRLLLTSHTADKAVILEPDGKISWEYPVPHPQDVWRLDNGNVLVAWTHGVREVTPERKVVWEHTTQAPNEIPTCQPLPDGRVLIGIVGECRLIEVDRAGKIVHQVQLSTPVKEPHAQFRFCRKTPEGTYLVPFTAEGAVREYDRDGKVIRAFPTPPMPVTALRLEDGHTLIGASHSVIEYDLNLRVVWELGDNDVPDINLATIAGVKRLANGNTLVCNWNAQDGGAKIGAHLFEVTTDKRVVWQLAGTPFGQVAQVQVVN